MASEVNKDTLNALLDAEGDRLCGAKRYMDMTRLRDLTTNSTAPQSA